jgi:hypothetical protein
MQQFSITVIPAKAGIQVLFAVFWTPASAGVTSAYYSIIFQNINNETYFSGLTYYQLYIPIALLLKRNKNVKQRRGSLFADLR